MEFTILNETNACCNPKIGCCDEYPVIVIGAGPIGLAAAAHLKQRNIPFYVVEKGDVAANVRTWQHVTLFSPWQYNVDTAAKQLLVENGWTPPNDDVIPTGEALVNEYLQPLAELMKDKILTNHDVVGIAREEADRMKSGNRQGRPFQLVLETTVGIKTMKARTIIDATGTWGNPNPAMSNGLWLKAEKQLQDVIDYTIPNVLENKETYMNKHIAVVGGGHSAINSLLQLVQLKEQHPETTITWILRKNRVEDAFGGGSNDELAARGELGMAISKYVNEGMIYVKTPFYIQGIFETSDGIMLKSSTEKLHDIDRLIVNTGNRPNFDFHRELRFETDPITEAVPALAPLIDPNEHSCGSVEAHGEKELRQPEQNFYIVGSKSYGRAPTFLMATGYEQVRSVVAYLAGDIEAASEVKLKLPETGVCHSGAGGCC
ncbi:MAG: NAD(P)-binding domain-containing protein [Lysinibacillus sp.]